MLGETLPFLEVARILALPNSQEPASFRVILIPLYDSAHIITADVCDSAYN